MQSIPNATKLGRAILFRVFLTFLLSLAAAVWAQENPPAPPPRNRLIRSPPTASSCTGG